MSKSYFEEIAVPHYSWWRLIKDVIHLVEPYKGRFWFATLLRLSTELVWLYPSYALAKIVTLLSNSPIRESLDEFWWLMGIWIIISIWHYVGENIAAYYGFQVGEKVALDAQLKTIKHMFTLDLAWHEKENTGNKIKRMQKGGEGLHIILRMWLLNFLRVMVQFVGMPFILFKFDTTIGLLSVFFLISDFCLAYILTKRTATAAYKVNVHEEEVLGLAFEAVNNIRSVKVMAMSEAIYKILRRSAADLFKKIRQRTFWFRTRASSLNIWAQIFRLGIIIFISYGIINGRYEVGLLVLFYSYFGYLWESVSQLEEMSQEFIVAKYGIARMQDILKEPVNIDEDEGKLDFPENWKTIKIQNLIFAYSKTPVLDKISLEINRGDRIGVVGLSGAGKSTLFKLLLKENESYAGEILFDNVPLRQIKRSSYLKKVAVVLQDTEVFNFSLEDNITIASHDIRPDKHLKDAIDIAHVSDFIPKLPQGLGTLIGEKGVKLSGGEKQRLGIARAVYKKPQILFLDEATSHLDLESEQKIRDSLHKFFQQVTAVVIAHRLTTIKEMDRIIVIEKGELLEAGTFEELYAKRGRFYELWEKQKL